MTHTADPNYSTRDPAPVPQWTERQLLAAQEKHEAEVRKLLKLLPWRWVPLTQPDLSNYQRDMCFFLTGGLMAQGVDFRTACELAADATVIVTAETVKKAKLRAAPVAGNA